MPAPYHARRGAAKASTLVRAPCYTGVMAGEGEAIGEFVSGGLFARAVSPPQPAAHAHDPHAAHACLNCGAALTGPFCRECGQEAHVHRTAAAILHDLAHGVLHLEGRFWSTLPMLALRPGELTRRYIAGERRKFVSPMAFFLFSVFTMFAVLSILGIAPPAELGNPGAQGIAAVEGARKDTIQAIKEAQADIADPDSKPEQVARARRELAQQQADLKRLEGAEKIFGGGKDMEETVHTGWARLDHGIEKAKKNPGLALYKLQANSYKFSWLLIPLSVPFVWIMFFWWRDVGAYDHAVFVTYSLAFMSLLFIVLTILGSFGVSMAVLGTIGTFVPAIHIYRQLRGAYRLGRINALIRTSVLLINIQIVVTLFVLAVVGLGLVG